MGITKNTIQEMIREELKSLNERPMKGDSGYVEKHKSIATVYKVMSGGKKVQVKLGKTGKKVVIDAKDIDILPESIMNERPRQLKDKNKEMMVVKNGKVQVIDKKDWKKYKKKGYLVAEKKIQTEDKNPCWDGYKQVGMKTKNGKQVPNCVKESVNEAKIVGSYPRRKEPHYSGIPTSKSSTEELVHTYIDTALISGYPFDDEDDNPNFDSGRQEADMKLFSYSQMLKKRGFDRRKLDKLVDTVRKKQTYPKIEENLNEKRAKEAVSGGKVHKFITGKNLTYKGKKYDDIEFELLGIDNRQQLVKLKILAPKKLFGDEMNVPFKTIRRGPFIKTDTSK